METAATTKRKSLRAMMLEPACHLAPSCNDGIQARLVEWLGFPPRQVMTIERWGELGGRVGCIPTVLQVAALHGMRQCLEELKRSGTEARYFKERPGIEERRKWYAEMGNLELKELEAKYRY